MEYLINNQARERRPGHENLDKRSGPNERRVLRQGSLQQKFSEERTNGYDSEGIDQAVAVAAAAQAIASLRNRPDIPVHRKIREGPPEPTTSQISSNKKGKKAVYIMEPGESSIRRTTGYIPTETSVPEIVPVDGDDNDDVLIKPVSPAPSMRRASSASLDDQITGGPGVATSDINIQARGSSGYVPSTKRAPSFPAEPTLPMQRIPSFAERQLNTMEETVPKTKRKALPEAEVHIPKTETEGSGLGPSTTRKPAIEIEVPKLDIPRQSTLKRQGSTMTERRDNPDVGTWERTKLDKIKKKYDELNNRINTWEDKKTAKARRRLNKTEVLSFQTLEHIVSEHITYKINAYNGVYMQRELERIRLKATNKYRTETLDIDNMAAAARAQAAERQRNEELKLKSKTNTVRTSAKVPRRTCFCF